MGDLWIHNRESPSWKQGATENSRRGLLFDLKLSVVSFTFVNVIPGDVVLEYGNKCISHKPAKSLLRNRNYLSSEIENMTVKDFSTLWRYRRESYSSGSKHFDHLKPVGHQFKKNTWWKQSTGYNAMQTQLQIYCNTAFVCDSLLYYCHHFNNMLMFWL